MAWKPSEQANMLKHRPTLTGSACSVYFEGTRSHNESSIDSRILHYYVCTLVRLDHE